MVFLRRNDRSFRVRLRRTPLLAYLEIAVGFTLLVALNVLFFRDHWGYLDVQPHPYWLIVIPIAVRYGALPGYLAGSVAAILYLLFAASSGQPLFGGDLLSSRPIIYSVLLLLAGAVFGELRETQREALTWVTEARDALKL